MFKKLVSLCVSFALLISVTGCGVLGVSDNTTESVTSTQTEKERVIEEAEAYLKESYPDDEFTYVSGKSPDWAYRYYELAFTTKKYDNQTVIVYGDPKKDDNPNSIVTSYYTDDNGDVIYDYFDTYYQYSMKEEAEKYFYNIAKRYFSNEIIVKIDFATALGSAEKVDKNESFENNYKKDSFAFFLYIFMENNNEEIENLMKLMLNEFKTNNCKLWVRLITVNNLSLVENQNIHDLKESGDTVENCVTYSTTFSEKAGYKMED